MSVNGQAWGWRQVGVAVAGGVSANVLKKYAEGWRIPSPAWSNALVHLLVAFGVVVLAAGLRQSLDKSDGAKRQVESDTFWLADVIVGSAVLGSLTGVFALSLAFRMPHALDFVVIPVAPDWFRWFEVCALFVVSFPLVWLVARKTDEARILSFVASYSTSSAVFAWLAIEGDYPPLWSGLNYALSLLTITILTAFLLRPQSKGAVGAAKNILLERKRRQPTSAAPPAAASATGQAGSAAVADPQSPVLSDHTALVMAETAKQHEHTRRSGSRWALFAVAVTIAVALLLPPRTQVPDGEPVGDEAETEVKVPTTPPLIDSSDAAPAPTPTALSIDSTRRPVAPAG